ncbi:type I polyketide synthase, partial [Micromonospora sp. ATCC 39149]|uniref:acyltransferase domain-containing protein n=1 Tax=Micromonospora sp. (strain ATCC 39149 / NRRL 15099 / SCC 1413) TaxID=219305 RepID=UPI0018DB5480
PKPPPASLGVIKMVLALQHHHLPKTLHAEHPTPQVDWTTGAVTLLTDAQPWPAREEGGGRRAAVSSFGISGTNAHVILEEAPEPAAPAEAEPAAAPGAEAAAAPVPWLLSARTDQALRDQAHRLAEHPTVSTHEPADVAHALLATRTRFEHRAVVLGTTRHELTTALAALAAGTTHPGVTTGVSAAAGRLTAMFTGQGSQRPGMGSALYATFPAFRDALDEVCAAFPHPLRAAILDDSDGTLHQTRWAQPAIFAVEVALYRLLESFGVTAHAMAGHSIGELTAAHLAGIWTLADAATVVTARARLMQDLPPGGAMLAVQATEAEVLAWIGANGLADHLGVAATNSPNNTVVSGDEEHVDAARQHFTALGRKTRPLRVSHAFHSHRMEPALDEFRAVLETVTFHPARVPVVSTVTGWPLTGEQAADPDYWAQQIRRTVRFHDAITHLRADGTTTFLEIGPDAALTPHVKETAPDATTLHTLRRDHDEVHTLLTAVAHLHTLGVPVIWDPLLTTPPTTHPDLPTYPFQHQRYWLDATGDRADVAAAGLGVAGHPLLGAAVQLADGDGLVLTGRLSRRTHPWLVDHAVMGTVLLPGTAFVELAIRAGDQVGAGRIEEITIEAPLLLPEEGGVQLQVIIGPADPSGHRELGVYSRPDNAEESWTRHVNGFLEPDAAPALDALAEWPPTGAVALERGARFTSGSPRPGHGYG